MAEGSTRPGAIPPRSPTSLLANICVKCYTGYQLHVGGIRLTLNRWSWYSLGAVQACTAAADTKPGWNGNGNEKTLQDQPKQWPTYRCAPFGQHIIPRSGQLQMPWALAQWRAAL
jgi:hypothetical protein